MFLDHVVLEKSYTANMLAAYYSKGCGSHDLFSKLEISKEEFLEICTFEIKKINKEVKEKEDLLGRYGEAIEKIKNPSNPVKMLV